MRPIWKILVIAAEHGAKVPLNCDECFAILEYLAEAAVQGAEEVYLLQAVRRHLERCPGCREHHLKRLRELEMQMAGKNSILKVNCEVSYGYQEGFCS